MATVGIGSATRFKRFAKSLSERESDQYAPLRNLVAPYILRRLKTDRSIISDLPDKIEVPVYSVLSKVQAVQYQRAVNQMKKASNVMEIVTDRNTGLFPKPGEIKLACDCPDWAEMCKHIAAVLYGVGARLDHEPELLFLLRNVDHEELITTALDITSATKKKGKGRRLAGVDLSDVFGVEMEEAIKPGCKKGTSSKAITAKAVTAASVSRLRKRFRMNTSQFARLVGVSPPTVSNWENGSG